MLWAGNLFALASTWEQVVSLARSDEAPFPPQTCTARRALSKRCPTATTETYRRTPGWRPVLRSNGKD